MATSKNVLSKDQLQCSICLDIFTEPVSTPCGHTFCKACLTRHWAGKQECQCPLCNNKFNKDLKLSVNTTFREVVENFKKHHTTAEATSLRPGEVSCDLCPMNKRRASKTCLVCLASFCEAHLEPHLTVSALQRHTLSNPLPDLVERVCRKHNRLFEFLCLSDHTRFCGLCTEHSDHHRVTLNETYVDQQSHIWKKKENIQETKKKMNGKSLSKKNGKGRAAETVKAHQTGAPHPFNGCNCMFHNPGIFGGKAFYEFHVNGKDGCDLAAVRESTLQRMTFPSNWDGCCIVRFRVTRNTNKIIVLVDYDNGLVLFFDPDNDILMYKLTGSRFQERILLCFIPSQNTCLNQVQSILVSLTPSSLDPFYFWLGLCIILVSIWIWYSL